MLKIKFVTNTSEKMTVSIAPQDYQAVGYQLVNNGPAFVRDSKSGITLMLQGDLMGDMLFVEYDGEFVAARRGGRLTLGKKLLLLSKGVS